MLFLFTKEDFLEGKLLLSYHSVQHALTQLQHVTWWLWQEETCVGAAAPGLSFHVRASHLCKVSPLIVFFTPKQVKLSFCAPRGGVKPPS